MLLQKDPNNPDLLLCSLGYGFYNAGVGGATTSTNAAQLNWTYANSLDAEIQNDPDYFFVYNLNTLTILLNMAILETVQAQTDNIGAMANALKVNYPKLLPYDYGAAAAIDVGELQIPFFNWDEANAKWVINYPSGSQLAPNDPTAWGPVFPIANFANWDAINMNEFYKSWRMGRQLTFDNAASLQNRSYQGNTLALLLGNCNWLYVNENLHGVLKGLNYVYPRDNDGRVRTEFTAAFPLGLVGNNNIHAIINNATKPFSDTSETVYKGNRIWQVLKSEYSAYYGVSKYKKIVMTSTNLPIQNESTKSYYTNENESLSSLKILTDFEVEIEPNTNRGVVVYNPSTYRLMEMASNEAIQTFDINIYYEAENLQLYPLPIEHDSIATLKLAFLKKSLYLGRETIYNIPIKEEENSGFAPLPQLGLKLPKDKRYLPQFV